ncbi:hypothetical protein HK101_006487 [Irineochytrium annulatum]|nr:hypothetical protein HK101_006487 [Irineochytrium annulatum]
MLRLGEKVVIVADAFEQNLPVGEYGFIIAYDRNPDNAFDYVLRVPQVNRNFFVPSGDVDLEEVLLKQEAERVEREALIDYALATHNEKLFHHLMNGDFQAVEEEEETANDVMSQADFIKQLHNKLHAKELSVSDLVDQAYQNIGAHDDKVKAYLALDEEQARARARQLDDRLVSGEEKGLLFGLPVGIKDNIVTNGLLVERLKAADTVTIGKLNMDEFAMGGSNENSSFSPIGPLTKNVEDSAYVLQAIAGYDAKDSTSAKVEIPDYLSGLTGDVKGLRIAVPKEYIGEGVDPQVKETVLSALKVLEGLGATWEEVSLPHTEYAVATYYLLASSEASSNLARFDGVRYGVRADNPDNLLDLYHQSRSQGFGPEVKRRIMLGTYALSSGYYDAYYLKAQKVRTLIKQDFDNVFAKYDVIIGPTAPTTAFKLGSQVDDPLTMYLNDILTIPVNLAGVPAVSIPCGFSDGLPVGLQIIEFHKQRPQL